MAIPCTESEYYEQDHELNGSAGCAALEIGPGALAHGIIRGVLNALHRFDAADLRRFAHAAVPVNLA